MSQIIVFNKPFNVLSQFTPIQSGDLSLSDYLAVPGFYPAGRLDKDSEGLLLLTDDGEIQHCISHPKQKMAKTYWVQVEGEISDAAIAALQRGLMLKDGLTAPAQAHKMAEPAIWPRQPPVRYRASIPTSWLSLTITEGRNRQVRRMTAATGFPTLRLIRYAVGPWTLDGLQPGQWQQLDIDRSRICHERKPRQSPSASHRGRHRGTGRPVPDGGRAHKRKKRPQPARRSRGKR